jgi:hypothetical protein
LAPAKAAYIEEVMMTTHTQESTANSAAKPRGRRKTLLVIEVALGIILAAALFATMQRNLIPISAQAAPQAMQGTQRGTPDATPAAASGTTAAQPLEAWYTPAQYLNQAAEAETLPSQF